MDLNEAKDAWISLTAKVKPECLSDLIEFINGTVEDMDVIDESTAEALKKLNKISGFIRDKTDISGNVSGEKLIWPTAGSFSDCEADKTDQVDAFLYDDMGLEELRGKGVVRQPNCCGDCGSDNIVEYNCISHSLSVNEIKYLFYDLLPTQIDVKDKVLVDIGSRLGAILYGGALLQPTFKTLIGIEISEEHCEIQKEALNYIGISKDKVRIIHGDFRDNREVLEKADIVFMNNVFSFFADKTKQTECWEALHNMLKPGTTLVHNHTVSHVVHHLNLSFELTDWLTLQYPDAKTAKKQDEDDFDGYSLCVYKVN